MSIQTKKSALEMGGDISTSRITNTYYPPFHHHYLTKATGGNLVSCLKVWLAASRNIYSSILFLKKLSKAWKITISLKRFDNNNNNNTYNSNNNKARQSSEIVGENEY